MFGKDKRSKVILKDQFFMPVCVLKHGGSWQFNAAVFKQRLSTFERLLTGFIKIAASLLYETLVAGVVVVVDMILLKENNQTFMFPPFAFYATEVISQQTNRPCKSMLEAKSYFSGKHKHHGLKTEASVLPNGLCFFFVKTLEWRRSRH